MDRFHDRQHVWLRSCVHGTYLNADSDGKSVSLRQRRESLKAAWAVHIYQGDVPYLLLYSAAYGRYLAATATPAPLAHLGFRAEQRDYDQPVVPAIMWRATATGFGNDVLLRNVGGRYLRANGKHTSKYLRWNNGVTVDDVDNVSTMMHWTVEPIPLRGPDMPQPGFAAPIPSRIPRELSAMLGRERGAWRLIRFVRASAEGEYAEDGNGWTEFQFRGRYVYHLRNELAKRINAEVHLFELAMCVRAGRYGRLTPLITNLPHGCNGETLQIVAYLSETPAYDELQHPDVYSQ
ncbi:hypothetical protein CFC21_107565 [Triticum aestivum]|uniref:DUF569 domain-containing protein n=1 Tax=Triticum aestivum TaxID=4565 RepID=A0A9R1MG93_WHEAT|nr:uncharacterized protein LOC123169272 [Triticum aestivum]KAF7106860.1 hypothetical protein CFC21_107565 [Triticum aestivum]